MTQIGGGDPSVGAFTQTQQTTTGQTTQAQTIGSQGFVDLQDALQQAEQLLENLGVYTKNMDEPPQLQKENQNVHEEDQSTYDETFLKDNAPEIFNKALSKSLNKLAAGPPPLTPTQQKQLGFALKYGPEAQVPDELAALVPELDDLIMEELAKEYSDPEDLLPSNSDYKKFKAQLSETKEKIFSAKLGQAVAEGKITPEQAKEINFARHFPEFAGPETQELLAGFEDQIATELGEALGVPAGTKIPLDSTAFIREMSDSFDIMFSAALEGLASEIGLNEEQVAMLKFMHAHPEIDFPGKAQLQGVSDQLTLAAASLIQGEFGFPDNFTPAPNSALFDGITKGFFRDEFSKQLTNFLKNDPSINAGNYIATKTMVQFALDNPNAKGIPSEIKELVNKFAGSAWEKVGAQFGIPPGALVIPFGPMTGGTADPAAVNYTQNLTTNLETRLNVANSLVLQMPSGATKNNLLNFLKTISDALSSLKEFLFELQTVDAAIGKQQTRGKLDEKLNQIEKERAMMEKMQEKLEKMGIVATSVEAIMAVATAVSMIPIIGQLLGPMIMALAVTLRVMFEVFKAIIKEVVKAVVKAVQKIVQKAVEKIVQKAVTQAATQGAQSAATGGAQASTQAAAQGTQQASAQGMKAALQQALTKGLGKVGEKGFKEMWKQALIDTYNQTIKAAFSNLVEFFKQAKSFLTSGTVGASTKSAIGTGLKALGKAVKKGIEETIEALINMIKAMGKMLQQLTTSAGRTELMNSVGNALEKLADGIVKSLSRSKPKPETSTQTAAKPEKVASDFLEDLANNDALWSQVEVGMMVTDTFFAGAQSGLQAYQSFERADIAMMEGEMEAMKEVIQSMIKIMQKTIDKLLNGLAGIAEDAAAITRMLEGIFASHSQVLTAATQANTSA